MYLSIPRPKHSLFIDIATRDDDILRFNRNMKMKKLNKNEKVVPLGPSYIGTYIPSEN